MSSMLDDILLIMQLLIWECYLDSQVKTQFWMIIFIN
jgi:hypothetical protein